MVTTRFITTQRMLQAGISKDEVKWYFDIAKPRGFSEPGDVERVLKIFDLTSKLVW